jgi:hypothetical protein
MISLRSGDNPGRASISGRSRGFFLHPAVACFLAAGGTPYPLISLGLPTIPVTVNGGRNVDSPAICLSWNWFFLGSREPSIIQEGGGNCQRGFDLAVSRGREQGGKIINFPSIPSIDRYVQISV